MAGITGIDAVRQAAFTFANAMEELDPKFCIYV